MLLMMMMMMMMSIIIDNDYGGGFPPHMTSTAQDPLRCLTTRGADRLASNKSMIGMKYDLK